MIWKGSWRSALLIPTTLASGGSRSRTLITRRRKEEPICSTHLRDGGTSDKVIAPGISGPQPDLHPLAVLGAARVRACRDDPGPGAQRREVRKQVILAPPEILL